MSEPNKEAVEPQLSQEERDAQSAEKYRAQLSGSVEPLRDPAADPAADDGKPQRPDNIPEKFWDAEKGEVRLDELAKSYAELEKAKSEAPAPKVEGTEGAAPKEGEGAPGEGEKGDKGKGAAAEKGKGAAAEKPAAADKGEKKEKK